ncbi:hypothetical protein An16g03150 [Aspergillus niger]|uniref:Uncharacterized protein n=2 Tax=Aspergillus niger TaxID=5061 RepID=A2R7D5_ASPNC|nr:hypothetical protein An16g03150 [Aspergillus niger]CAK48624.1 hypothetical protein An16g03150 [Aspergillus niger]
MVIALSQLCDKSNDHILFSSYWMACMECITKIDCLFVAVRYCHGWLGWCDLTCQAYNTTAYCHILRRHHRQRRGAKQPWPHLMDHGTTDYLSVYGWAQLDIICAKWISIGLSGRYMFFSAQKFIPSSSMIRFLEGGGSLTNRPTWALDSGWGPHRTDTLFPPSCGGSFIGLNRRNDWMGRLISARDSAEQGQHPSWGGSVRIKGAPVAVFFPVVKLRRNTTRGGECQVANLTGVKHILSAFVRRQTSRALFRSMSVKTDMDGTTDDRSYGPSCLDWGPWIAYATFARIGWLARQLDSDEDTCTSSSSSLFLWFYALKPDAHQSVPIT